MQTIPAIAALQTLANRCVDTRFTLFIACPHTATTIRHQPGHYRYYPSLIYTTSIEELLQKFFAPQATIFSCKEFSSFTFYLRGAWSLHQKR
jgi:hypothetical protein